MRSKNQLKVILMVFFVFSILYRDNTFSIIIFLHYIPNLLSFSYSSLIKTFNQTVCLGTILFSLNIDGHFISRYFLKLVLLQTQKKTVSCLAESAKGHFVPRQDLYQIGTNFGCPV